MEKKVPTRNPLLIIAAVLSGVGGILSCTIISEWGHYSYDSIIQQAGTGLSIFIFTVMTALLIAEKLSLKWLALPFALYSFSTIVLILINVMTDIIYLAVYSFNLLLHIATLSLLVLTALKIINTKIPAIAIVAVNLILILTAVLVSVNAYSIGNLLYFIAILLLLISLPRDAQAQSSSTQNSALFEEQNLAFCIVLSIVTCGIYGLVWKYQLCRKIRILNGESTDCVGEYLCLILVPFYFLYWYYTRGQKLYQGMKEVGAPASDNSVVNLVLALFGFSIVSDALIQNDLNKAASVLQVRSRTVPVEAENSVSTSGEEAVQEEAPSEDKTAPAAKNIALLQQLAELHDKGILSDEEFEEKKKDLLDRI